LVTLNREGAFAMSVHVQPITPADSLARLRQRMIREVEIFLESGIARAAKDARRMIPTRTARRPAPLTPPAPPAPPAPPESHASHASPASPAPPARPAAACASWYHGPSVAAAAAAAAGENGPC
jgi:hypothetical protein